MTNTMISKMLKLGFSIFGFVFDANMTKKLKFLIEQIKYKINQEQKWILKDFNFLLIKIQKY